MVKKPSMGRQKIKIEKIVVKTHLQVTFSKRRSGLFKKASELCTLCGTQIAIIVFSPAGKVFSFGHPNVESILDRFLSRNNNSLQHDPFQLMEAQTNVNVRELNLQLGQILNEMEVERSKSENLDSMRKTGQSQYWWEAPVSKLGLEELEQLRDAMADLKKSVCQQVATLINTSPSSLFISTTVFDQYESKPGINNINAAGNAAAAALNANFQYSRRIGYFLA